MKKFILTFLIFFMFYSTVNAVILTPKKCSSNYQRKLELLINIYYLKYQTALGKPAQCYLEIYRALLAEQASCQLGEIQ